MENESKREKFLLWVIKNANQVWLWLPVLLISAALISFHVPGLGGLALTLWGGLMFAAGINLALEAVLGDDYTLKDARKKK